MIADREIASTDAASSRFERKFIAAGYDSEDVRLRFRMHPAGLRIMHPPRTVNTMYFDTAEWTMYRVHVHGDSERKKVRLRWYGDLNYTGPLRLEIKHKRGLAGWKDVYNLAACDPFQLAFDKPALREAALAAGASGGFATRFMTLHPTVLVRYDREYWRASGTQLRLTLDYNVGYHIARRAGQSKHLMGVRDDTPVIELKYPVDAETQVETVTRHLPFRVMKNSKYINAMERLFVI